MKSSFLPPTAEQEARKSSQKREFLRVPIIPTGFHPLSGKMVDVLVAMQQEFEPVPDWWRRGASMRELAGAYYQALRKVLRDSPRSRRHLTRCCHCEIFF